MTAAEPLLEASHLFKRFGAVDALIDVSLALYPAEVVGIVGANGAGKSTLIKILSGVATPDSGEIMMDGQPVRLQRPADARACGIETVYQDLSLIDTLDASGNIFLGRELLRFRTLGWLDIDRMHSEATQLFRRLGATVDPRKSVAAMSGGQRQAVALARVAYFETRVVILDEPTAALGHAETAAANALIRQFRAEGASVVVVSHDLESIFGISDRIIVMRHGRVVGAHQTTTVRDHEIIAQMTLDSSARPEAEVSAQS